MLVKFMNLFCITGALLIYLLQEKKETGKGSREKEVGKKRKIKVEGKGDHRRDRHEKTESLQN
jgi:hypothetical protein